MTNHTVLSWRELRSPDFIPDGADLIREHCPANVEVFSIEHLRSGHYAAYRVQTSDGRQWLVRVGLTDASDLAEVDNTGFLGTAIASPTGQLREMEIANGFASAGAAVIPAEAHLRTPAGFDLLWAPFLHGDEIPLTAAAWHRALTSLYAYRPAIALPVFTNRIKTIGKLAAIPDREAVDDLLRTYDRQLEHLFSVATGWSAVHGDAHGGNALNIDGDALLFDFDTVCWAPSVWDLTHLLTRGGTGVNSGYTAAELIDFFAFEPDEIQAAIDLRLTAKRAGHLQALYP